MLGQQSYPTIAGIYAKIPTKFEKEKKQSNQLQESGKIQPEMEREGERAEKPQQFHPLHTHPGPLPSPHDSRISTNILK